MPNLAGVTFKSTSNFAFSAVLASFWTGFNWTLRKPPFWISALGGIGLLTGFYISRCASYNIYFNIIDKTSMIGDKPELCGS